MKHSQVKYRIWHKNIQEMAQVRKLPFKKNGSVDLSSNEVLLRWTGFKDCQGKDIYEGHVLLFINQEATHKPIEVKWEDHMTLLDDEWLEYPNKYTNVKIIGNIYSNPKLLKELTVGEN